MTFLPHLPALQRIRLSRETSVEWDETTGMIQMGDSTGKMGHDTDMDRPGIIPVVCFPWGMVSYQAQAWISTKKSPTGQDSGHVCMYNIVKHIYICIINDFLIIYRHMLEMTLQILDTNPFFCRCSSSTATDIALLWAKMMTTACRGT